MDLRTYQRTLSGLIRDDYSPGPDDDAYFRQIARSEKLEVTREIVLWWRQMSLERACVLTSRALKAFGLFEAETETFVNRYRFSPFIELLSDEFLEWLSGHRVELLATVACFERALIRSKRGSSEPVSIQWGHNPYVVFDALLNGGDLSEIAQEGNYTTVVSPDLPGGFRVYSEQ